MKIISNKHVDGMLEIIVEYSFLFIKYRKVYRIKDGKILQYYGHGRYGLLSLYERDLVRQLIHFS